MILDFNNKLINNEVIDEKEVIPKGFIEEENMEFIKVGKNYLIKNSNGIIVDEKEKLKLEKNELVIQDIKSDNCQEKTTKKIKKINKKLEEKEEVTDDAVIKEAV
jgi:hypothetical protein